MAQTTEPRTLSSVCGELERPDCEKRRGSLVPARRGGREWRAERAAAAHFQVSDIALPADLDRLKPRLGRSDSKPTQSLASPHLARRQAND